MSWVTELLELGRTDDTFIAPRPSGPGGRLFGGLIAAQALAAAGATIGPGKAPQSLHAYFVRAGRPWIDVLFEVERTRDGRSFDTRRVTASQDGQIILEMLTSFHVPEAGTDWHPPAPDIVALEDATVMHGPNAMSDRFEIRVPELGPGGWAGLPYWIRTVEPIEDDLLIRACTLTYLSDMGLMAAARPRDLPLPTEPGSAASLDHAIWFQRPFHPDRWHRYQAVPLNNNDARGLAVGSLYDSSGTLVATMTQEALWRE